MEGLPWVEKYRPAELGDILAQREIVGTVERFADKGQLPHMLFYGPPGTGKTTTVLALARKLYGNQVRSMVLELNASDDRGIDVVRQQIKDFVSTRKVFSKGVKIVVLDEADAMTKAAQMALRRVIEKYTKNARFCLICNYVSQIIPAIQSRCTRFRFAPLEPGLILPRLQQIAGQEQVSATTEGLQAVMRLSGGDMRKCLNIMQAATMAHAEISEATVYACTGNPAPAVVRDLLHELQTADFAVAAASLATLQRTRGVALLDLVRELHGLLLPSKHFDRDTKLYLLARLAALEEALQLGCSESIHADALVAAFMLIRDPRNIKP